MFVSAYFVYYSNCVEKTPVVSTGIKMVHVSKLFSKRSLFSFLCGAFFMIVIPQYHLNVFNHFYALKGVDPDVPKVEIIKEEDYQVDWDSIKLRAKPDDSLIHDKWIVITTINPPTSDVKKLAAIPGWKVVIVGDTKSPKEWSHSNCIHLHVEDQLKLNYLMTDLLRYKSYARKNIGFMYAIAHGAKVIYETDDDNSPTSGQIGFDPESRLSYLKYEATGEGVMNPYAYFGQSSIWPRGYPLDMIGKDPSYNYRNCNNTHALVQQGIVNGDPDVDAIYRLTRKDKNVILNISFDSSKGPLLLPKGVIAPYNSQNTLHLYNAFWGLVLPQTVAFRVCDIWRGYWAQRLLWELDSNLAFFAPNAFTVRNSHSYFEDYIDEEDLYKKSGSFVKFLIDWKPKKTLFFDKVIELSIEMTKAGFWGVDDIKLIKLWLIDLVSIGYKPPSVSLSSPICSSVISVPPNEQRTSHLRKKTPV